MFKGRKSNAFTSEGTPCLGAPPKMRRFGFTLAEVLITLGVIGVVAAMTLPTLINTVRDKVEARQKQVMERKFVEGLNMFNHEDEGLIRTYANTEEFVRGLSKHLKMVQICGNTNLQSCFTDDKIYYAKSDGTLDYVDVSSITTAKKLKLEGNWLDPAGFIMANGTPIIISWNNDCAASATDEYGHSLISPDTPLKDIPSSCIDGVWDIGGRKAQNTYGKDVRPFFAAKIGSNCIAEVANVCISTTPLLPTPITYDECIANKEKYGINVCMQGFVSDQDSWGGAMKYCSEKGMRLPTIAELTEIAKYLYNDSSISTEYKNGLNLDISKAPEPFVGIDLPWRFWASTANSMNGDYRGFWQRDTQTNHVQRVVNSNYVFCVSDD